MILSKHPGPALETPFPHIATSLPQRPGPARPSPPPAHELPSPWKLESPGLASGVRGHPSPRRSLRPQWACVPGSQIQAAPREALAGLPDTLSLLHYCAALASSAMRPPPATHRAWAGGRPPRSTDQQGDTGAELGWRRSIGGSEPQSGEVLSPTSPSRLWLDRGWGRLRKPMA